MNAVLPPQQMAVSPSQPCLWDSTAWLYNFSSRGCEGEFIDPEKEKKRLRILVQTKRRLKGPKQLF